MAQTKNPKIIVALDHADIEEARLLVSKLDPDLCRLKIGNILFTHYGPRLVEEFMKKGFSIFLDLKFHDIPNTVAGACRSAAALGVWMVNVHALGGREMLLAASDALAKVSRKKPLLIGVTVLTSMNDQDLIFLGIKKEITELVPSLAQLAKESGLNGVVCSAQEAAFLREKVGKDFLLVTPGIRLASDEQGDQKRVMTPKAAIEAGADYLVIGRPITQAQNPLQVLEAVQSEIAVARVKLAPGCMNKYLIDIMN